MKSFFILDDTPPSIACPQSSVAEVAKQQDFYEMVFNDSHFTVNVVDHSNISSITFNPPAANMTVDSFQNISVTATDVFGNKAICYFQVVVKGELIDKHFLLI